MDSHPKLTVNGPNEKRVTTLHVQPVAPSPSSILTSSDPTLWDTQFADSARQWTTATKVAISVLAIVSFFVITLANSIYIAGIPGVRAEFQIGTTLAISPVALYAMGFAVGPLLSSALSEKFGRKWAIKCSLLLHLIFTIVGAIAPNFRTLAVARALSGILGSPLVTIFVGVLNDLWKMPEDHLAVPVFLLYGLGGISAPTVGPVIGQAVVENGGWRWTFWLIAILVGLCFLAAIPIEETYEPVVRRKASNIPGRDWQNVVGRAFLRPLHMLWVERIIWPTTSITVAGQVVLFVFYAAFPIMLDEVYEFTPYETGLAFLAQLVAGVLAFPVLGFIERKGRASAKRDPEFILDGGKLAGTAMWTSLIM
ncbi:hypothetical protein E8E15_000980 [Penicillium rubens]|nr:hypothetical protein E8E15_000980 [Penicillium rubens]